jgi:predicted metalloprotease with PDZ domain
VKLQAAILLILLTGAGGCATRRETAANGSPTMVSGASDHTPSAAASVTASSPRKPVKAPGEPFELPAYAVRESAFTDFGMSVKTNLAVKWGDGVEWMEVSGVVRESSAAKQHLQAGDRILAIDGQLITKFGRDSMLDALFQRKAGDRVELLVMSAGQALPRYVTLTAERPRRAN